MSVDFLIEGEGMAGVAGHISNIHQNPKYLFLFLHSVLFCCLFVFCLLFIFISLIDLVPSYGGYYLMISNNGDWNLLLSMNPHTTQLALAHLVSLDSLDSLVSLDFPAPSFFSSLFAFF